MENVAAGWQALQPADLPVIVPLEQQLYSHPWTLGNFEDSFSSGHEVWGWRKDAELNADGKASGELAAYFVTMPVVDELHLLNFAVAKTFQGQGLARRMMDFLLLRAVQQGMQSVLLEVRVSNQRAIHVYQQAGFTEIGRRKNYYPVSASQKEDAIVMRRMC